MCIKPSKPIWKVSRAVRAKAARDLIIKISSAQAATALRQGDWDPLIKHFEQGLPLTDELRPLLIRILKPDLKRPQNRHPKNETLQRGMRMAARAYQLEHPHLILRDIEEELKHIPESDTRHREILTAFARRFEADAKKKVNETVAAEFRCSVRTVTNARKKFRIG